MVVLKLCIAAAVAFLPAWGIPHPQDSGPSSGWEGPVKAAPAFHVPSALLGAGVMTVPAAIVDGLLLKKVRAQERQHAQEMLQAQARQHAQEMQQAQLVIRQERDLVQAHAMLGMASQQAVHLWKALQGKEATISAGEMRQSSLVWYQRRLDNLIKSLWRTDRHHQLLPPKTAMPPAFEHDLDMRDCVLKTYLDFSTYRLIEDIDTYVTWDTAVNKCLEKLHRPDADKHYWYLQGSSVDPSYRPPATAHAIQQEEQRSKPQPKEPDHEALQFSNHAAAQVLHASRKWAPFAQRAFRFLEHPGADAIPAELRWAGEHHL
ncbi:MAG: hypothetical protein M1826_004192 [Phylliscum demangeonii]|nr:MAG: hypothetical protein M1826_004192 [Phylliscum demangeonii]